MVSVGRIMIEELEVPGELMMEHAGSNLARLAVKCTNDGSNKFRIIVGSGNNGAGGMVAARRLVAWGYNVEVYAPRGVISFRRVPAGQYARLRSLGVSVFNGLPSDSDLSDIIVDAYLGYGFVSREDMITDQVFNYLSNSKCTVCLDVPSGFDIDTGEGQEGFKPKSTLTIAFAKEGLLRAYPILTGDLYVCDIGVPIELYRSRVDFKWTKPYSPESLLQLVDVFQRNSMAKVEVVREDEKFGWMPSFVSI